MEETVAHARPPTQPGASEVEALKADIRRRREAALATPREMSTMLGLEEDNGRVNDYISAPITRAQRCEAINIADERSPFSPGLEAKP